MYPSIARLVPVMCCAFCLVAMQDASAASIPVVYQGSILEGEPGVDQGLPIFLSGSPNNVRFKFFVPAYASILSLDSVDVSVDLYDDGDGNNGEAGELAFVLNGVGLPNLSLNFFGGLNGYTSGSPLQLSGSVSSLDLPDVLMEIQGDGIFFLRVNRDGNDFFVDGPSVSLEGELLAVPEPASLVLTSAALAGLILWRRCSGSA